jgi:hypothetical protein
VPASLTRPVSLVVLGVTLFIAGFVGNWLQDAAAPWINLGEARMGSTVTFTADRGKYRVITSGPTRPKIEQVGCTIVPATGSSRRALGGTGGVNQRDALGVSRVLEFRTPPGETRLTCSDRILTASTHGRFQVVAADGLVSRAVLAAFVLGGLSLLAGVAWLALLYRRRAPAAG